MIVGCRTDDGGRATDGGATDGGLAGPGSAIALRWVPCDDTPPGDASWRPIECAQMAVPLDWSAPLGPTLSLNLRRIRAAERPRGQLWMLAGGPGDSGLDLVSAAETAIAPRLPDLDVYMPDHRGTGRSHWIDCPDGDVTPSCITSLSERADGKDLPLFSTTQAARDVARAIDALREPGAQVFVYGVSYGTFLLNRYLSLYPDQATAVVMDSVVPAKGFRLADYDANGNRVARDLLAQCARDAFCAGKVGPDPWGALGQLYDRLDAGHCPELAGNGIAKGDIQRFLRALLAGPGLRADARKLVPALIYRVDRCSPSDVAVVRRALSAHRGRTAAEATIASESSTVLAVSIAASEGWFPPPVPTLSQMAADEDGYYVTGGISQEFLQWVDEWTLPRYPVDPSLQEWARTDIPVLLLDGTLDIETPLFLLGDAPAHFDKPHQRFVAVRNSGHEAISATAVPPSPGQEAYGSCGLQMVARFFEDPTAPLDTTCADAPPIDFASGLTAPSQVYFGVDDPYDGEPAPSSGD